MRIGIDGHVLGKNIGGVERFVRELVNHLPSIAPQHEYIVFVTKQEYAKVQQMSVPKNLQFFPLATANPLLERLLVLPWLSYKHKLDALLVQRLAPWFCGRCKLIVTVHDLTPIKFANAYKGLSNKLVRLLTKNSIRRASLILTPTNTIKAEINQYCADANAPIVAFYNGVDAEKFLNAASSQADAPPYLLTVGAIESRKNIETILEALPKLNQPEVKLVIVGSVRDAAYKQALQAQIAKLGLQSRVTFVGFTEEAELIRLYQQAALFITASKDEGFNIPPLEAMACGTPVVCSDIAVHRELFDSAAQFFATTSADDLAKQLNLLLTDAKASQALTQAAYPKVKTYNWTQTAHNVAASLGLLK